MVGGATPWMFTYALAHGYVSADVRASGGKSRPYHIRPGPRPGSYAAHLSGIYENALAIRSIYIATKRSTSTPTDASTFERRGWANFGSMSSIFSK
jgi:hypothetical protein